jgi:CII-binding regulator of phage lambda lysogenization HflD
MENILVDIELLRAIKSTNASDKDKENNLGDLYLYKKYDIDSLQLLESKKHYSKNPKQYVLIYEAVENKLKFLKDSLNNLGEKINQVD